LEGDRGICVVATVSLGVFVFCGVEVNKFPSCGGAVFLILNLRYSVKRNNSQTLCGVVVYHMAEVTKTEEPGLLISTTTR